MLDAIKQRDRDLVSRYRAVCDRLQPGERADRRALAQRAVMGGAPCYYVTYDYAYRMLRALRRGRLPPGYPRLKLNMWQEIAGKTDRYKQSVGIKSDAEALSVVLARNTASRFFVSIEYALRILDKINYEKEQQKTINEPVVHGGVLRGVYNASAQRH